MEMVNFFDLKCKSDICTYVYIVCSWTDQNTVRDIKIRIILHGMLKTMCVMVARKSLLSAKMCLCVHQSIHTTCVT